MAPYIVWTLLYISLAVGCHALFDIQWPDLPQKKKVKKEILERRLIELIESVEQVIDQLIKNVDELTKEVDQLTKKADQLAESVNQLVNDKSICKKPHICMWCGAIASDKCSNCGLKQEEVEKKLAESKLEEKTETGEINPGYYCYFKCNQCGCGTGGNCVTKCSSCDACNWIVYQVLPDGAAGRWLPLVEKGYWCIFQCKRCRRKRADASMNECECGAAHWIVRRVSNKGIWLPELEYFTKDGKIKKSVDGVVSNV